MCGIFGAIGQSKNPQVSFDLLNSLFLKTEHRGTDASGFYGIYPGTGADAGVIFDKEPKKSSEYVRECSHWNQIFKNNPNVDEFIGHCRQTSQGVGSEKYNKNNHPHLSEDRTVAMVHNGKVPEFTALKSKYDMNSDCDSEILLRMFESARAISKGREKELKEEFPTLNPFLSERLLGLKEIFSRVNYGAMAVAIAERGEDGQRYLWLFRDDERPLHVVDMRKTLGQIFFCSTADIWRNAIDATPSVKPFIPQDQVIIEFPPLQIWLLNFDPNQAKDVPVLNTLPGMDATEKEFGAECWNIRKFRIAKTKYIDWKQEDDEDDKLSFKRGKDAGPVTIPMKVTSRLGANQEPAKEKKEEPPTLPPVKAEGNGKKKINSGSSGGVNATPGKIPVSAKVTIREPGEDSEDWTGPPDNQGDVQFNREDIIKDAKPVGTEEIDLDAFDTILEKLKKDADRLKNEVHTRSKEKSLSGRDFSVIIDRLETCRSEVEAALSDLTGK